MKIKIKKMLKYNMHLSHYKRYRKPSIEKYIYCDFNGIGIINLITIVKKIYDLVKYIKRKKIRRKEIIIICIKKNIREVLELFLVNKSNILVCKRWMGGSVTNKLYNKITNIRLIFIIDSVYHRNILSEINHIQIDSICLSDLKKEDSKFFIPMNDDSVNSVLYFFKILFKILI